MKKPIACPNCAAQLKANQRKCDYCGSELERDFEEVRTYNNVAEFFWEKHEIVHKLTDGSEIRKLLQYGTQPIKRFK